MVGVGKCKQCGSTEIEVDPARGDSVCTNCGSVLESSAIVSEVQFEENAHGGSSAIGQFVSADSRGGARGFGGTFNYGLGQESRELTLQNARRSISNLGQQLRLNQHCVDTAFNFYKMALTRGLTRGRKNSLVVAACVYLTCRTEGTAHLLIDCSDVLQINVYELGRTYLKLSQALSIAIPSVDPCLYILRFASRLQFGERTHEVSMTALRLVQRMKKDSIHTGRRPSGLCGAALLMAARLHDFNRTVEEVIRVVKVHHTTLRKRLLEFGETPSSCLTLDEFMTVDLEEEQDPPSFKAARIKDRERLQKLLSDNSAPSQFSEIRKEIDIVLDSNKSKKAVPKGPKETVKSSGIKGTGESCDLFEPDVLEAASYIETATTDFITEFCEAEVPDGDYCVKPSGLGPNLRPFIGNSISEALEMRANVRPPPVDESNGELMLTGIDDQEIDSYILSKSEVTKKTVIWNSINADYLQAQKLKEEKLEKDKEEGKPEKKRKRTYKKNSKPLLNPTATEAFCKMLKEKRLSNKINYEVLKDLSKDFGSAALNKRINPLANVANVDEPEEPPCVVVESAKPRKKSRSVKSKVQPKKKKRSKIPETEKLPVLNEVEGITRIQEHGGILIAHEPIVQGDVDSPTKTGSDNSVDSGTASEPELEPNNDLDDDDHVGEDVDPNSNLSTMLQKHNQMDADDDGFGYDYDFEEEY